MNKFENHLLSIRDERQKMIHPNSHPTYNERHEKIIELIDWSLEKYKEETVTNTKKNQNNEEQGVIIDNIIEELEKKRHSYKQKERLLKEGKIYRDICHIAHVSSREIKPIAKEYERKKRLENKREEKDNQSSQIKKLSLSSRAFKLFSDGKNLL